MLKNTSLPVSIATRLNNVVQSFNQSDDSQAKSLAYSNLLSIIASMVAATSGSLLLYNSSTKQSTVIAEYGSGRMGILERRSDIGESYDEREFRILFKWIESRNHLPLMLHVDGLPDSSKERRELQSYAIHSSLCLPILGIGDTFQGYIELWESRYKRVYNEAELDHLMQATTYISKIMTA